MIKSLLQNYASKLKRIPGAKTSIKFILKPLRKRADKRLFEYYKQQIHNGSESNQLLTVQQEIKRLTYKPLMSIVVPVYDPPLHFFNEMIESVKAQSYDNWELILVDDASPSNQVREAMQALAAEEKRIKTKYLKKNLHISGATNTGIEMAKGEFVCLLDHDDILWPNALHEVVSVLNDKPYDFIYTDEDKVTEDRNDHRDPFFKPDWNQDFMYSVNYITHFSVIRKSVLDKIGYEKNDYNGAQDWELFLRTARSIKPEKIFHLPEVVYSWRLHSNSTAKNMEAKPYAVEAQKRAIESDLIARGLSNFIVRQDDVFNGQWQLMPKEKNTPSVSIILKNPENGEKLQKHITEHTAYNNYEIVEWKKDMSLQDVLSSAKGDYVAVIDSRIKISDTEWVQGMLADAERPDIGMVLARTNLSSVMLHLKDLLGPERSKLVAAAKRGLSMHLYRTTRYNIPRVYRGVVLMNSEKARNVIQKDTKDSTQLSELMFKAGHRHLYNPYIDIKVLK